MKRDWIKVNEMLPINDRHVLVTDGNDITIGSYSKYTGDEGWAVIYGIQTVDENKITHWMEMPEIPLK